MIFLIVVAVLMGGYGAAYVASDDVRYLTRSGFEETQILAARRPIERLLADTATPTPLHGPKSFPLVLCHVAWPKASM